MTVKVAPRRKLQKFPVVSGKPMVVEWDTNKQYSTNCGCGYHIKDGSLTECYLQMNSVATASHTCSKCNKKGSKKIGRCDEINHRFTINVIYRNFVIFFFDCSSSDELISKMKKSSLFESISNHCKSGLFHIDGGVINIQFSIARFLQPSTKIQPSLQPLLKH